MSDPLLFLAANPDVTQGALRMGGIPNDNQSVGSGIHPFAQLLASHVPPAGAGLEAGGELRPVAQPGKPIGQFLAADGKALPDPARLLAQAGLALEGEEGLPRSAAGLGGELDSVELLAGQVEEGLAHTLSLENVVTDPAMPDTIDAERVAALPPQAEARILENPIGKPVPGHEPVPGSLATAPRPMTGAESQPAEWAAPVAMAASGRQQHSVAPLAPPVEDPQLDPELPPMPEQARVVSTAVHQALQQRAGDEGVRGARFGDLIRSVASQGAEPPPRAELPVGLGPQASASAQAQAPALPTTAVAIPLRQAGWGQALGEQVQWMVGNKLQGAEIRLNPAHLGPMEVRVQIQNDQATISFTAQHGMVREALEAAIPRLREMLGESGLQLNNVTVSDQSLAEQRRQEAQSSFAGRSAAGTGEEMAQEEEVLLAVTPLREGAGTIDYFA